jgi:aminoglycoside 6-adenylyltransferase
MDKVAAAYEQLMDHFVTWAETEANIRAAIVIGSRARTDHPADQWSDLDVLIFAEDPQPYQGVDWLQHVGTPWLSFLEPTPDGQGYERRVLFEGGLDVDFVPLPVAYLEQWLTQGFPPDLADMVSRGVRFLVDKEGFAARLDALNIEPPPYTPPAEAEFLNGVHDFWYHTVWTSKHLRRGELWWAKSCCDGYLKGLLHRMLAWHARATQDEVDTWMRGRYLEEWADPRAVEALADAYAHYNEADVWRALQATMDLFGWLTVETAEALGYSYPTEGEAHARTLVKRMAAGKPLLD